MVLNVENENWQLQGEIYIYWEILRYISKQTIGERRYNGNYKILSTKWQHTTTSFIYILHIKM